MDLHPNPEPGGPDGPPLTEDRLLLGIIGGPAICEPCGRWIVQLEAGHWRLSEKNHAEDRIVCKVSGDRWHHPIGETRPSEPPSVMRSVSPPWSRSVLESRTGDPA